MSIKSLEARLLFELIWSSFLSNRWFLYIYFSFAEFARFRNLKSIPYSVRKNITKYKIKASLVTRFSRVSKSDVSFRRKKVSYNSVEATQLACVPFHLRTTLNIIKYHIQSTVKTQPLRFDCASTGNRSVT